MAIRLNWKKIRAIHEHLRKEDGLLDSTEITFVMITKDGSAKKSVIKFKDFLPFFWAVADNKDYEVLTLIVQDNDGRILYRHNQVTAGQEEIPNGGNAGVLLHWNELTPEEKNVYVRLTVAQIDAYER